MLMSVFVLDPRLRTDFPTPEITVNCLADGVLVEILMGSGGFSINNTDFNGLLYVKGHSKDANCRKSIQSDYGPVDFKVKFGTCGLIHVDVSLHLAFPYGNSGVCTNNYFT